MSGKEEPIWPEGSRLGLQGLTLGLLFLENSCYRQRWQALLGEWLHGSQVPSALSI